MAGLATGLGGGFLAMIFQGQFPQRLLDEKRLSTEKRRVVEGKIQLLAEKIGLHKSIDIIDSTGISHYAQAFGSGLLDAGRAIICVQSEVFETLNEGEMEFILAREIVHIKKGHTVLAPAFTGIVTITMLASLVFMFPKFPPVARFMLIAAACCANAAICFRIHEQETNREAITICSEEGLRGGKKLFEERSANNDVRFQMIRALIETPTQDRIAAIDQEIATRARLGGIRE